MINGKNNYKQVVLESKLDFTVYLNQLILITFKNLDRFKKYLKDLDILIEEYTDEKNHLKPIPSNIFLELHDKIDGPMKTLFNVLADDSELAASYYKFKKFIDKRQLKEEDAFALTGLKDNEELRIIIQELNSLRNWHCHIPESTFISQRYADSLSCNGEDVTKDYSQSEIKVFIYEKHESEWATYKKDMLESFKKSFQYVFKNMKQDYSKLVGQSMNIRRAYFDSIYSRPFCSGEMGQLSYAINQGKLKGINLNNID